MLSQNVLNIVYVFAAVLFILDLKWMAHPRTAVRGNQAGVLGMLVAIVATLLSDRFDWSYILIGVAVGALIGAVAAIIAYSLLPVERMLISAILFSLLSMFLLKRQIEHQFLAVADE